MDYDKKDRLVEATFDLILEKIKTVSNVFLTILLVGLTLLMGASITMRYFWDQPISWSNAIARYLYIYIVLIGSAVSYMLDGHATIESFYYKMPESIKKLFDLIHYIVVMGLSGLLIVNGTKYAIGMWGINSPVLMNFSMGIVYLAVPIGFLIIFLYLLKKIIFMWR